MKLTHITGPLAGQTQQFEDSVDVLLVGRDPRAQILFPLDFAAVARQHVRLRRMETGDYRIQLIANRYVEIDGVRAEDNALIRSGAILTLGGPDGPSFLIEYELEPFTLPCPPPMRSEGVSGSARRQPNRTASVGETGGKMDVSQLLEMRANADAITIGVARTGVERAERPPIPNQKVWREQRDLSNLNWLLTAAIIAAVTAMIAWQMARNAGLLAGLAKLFKSAVPPAPAPVLATPASDLVDVCAFAPNALAPEEEGLLQVLLHKFGDEKIAAAMAAEADPSAKRRGVQTLATEIAHGREVQIKVEAKGLDIDGSVQGLIWQGVPRACQFPLKMPHCKPGTKFNVAIFVSLDSIPIGTLRFLLFASEEADASRPIDIVRSRARRYHRAFLSYASPDRADVLRGAQLLQTVGIDFFNDLLSLEPGEKWEKRLFEEIDQSDLFLLFWSSHAKASEWVLRETKYALKRQSDTNGEVPDIRPVILEGPPPPEPPAELAHLHFNDRVMFVLAALKAQTGDGSPSPSMRR